MNKTKVAVIGLGGIAQLVHLPNLSKIGNVVISAVAETNKSRLNAVADKFNVKERYTDYNELLKNSDAEAVIVATPTSTHKDVAIACLKADRHVLVEKPLARTYKEAKPIVEAAQKHKKHVMVGMNFRYRPDAMILKSILASGEAGQPFYVKAGWVRSQSSESKWFTKKNESGGGVIIDLGIMLLDLSLWILDYPPVTSVSTINYSHNTKTVEDTSISFVRCKNSSSINLETSWSLPLDKDTFYMNVFCDKGFASLNPFRIYKKINQQVIELTPAQTESSLSVLKKSYMNELKSFIGAVKGLHPVVSSGDEALQRMKVVDSMYQSASENKEILI